MAENFFQRWFWIVLPIVLMAMIGVMMAQRVQPEYLASSTMSTSANPLVAAPDIRGTELKFLESPGEATARVITARLGTDRFASNVAERAGLDAAVEAGLLSYLDLRQSVKVFAAGESLVTIETLWGDPETSLRINEAMIDEYLSVLRSTVSEDAQAAVDFYEDRRTEAIVRVDDASATLNTFVAQLPDLPDDVDLPVPDQLALERLYQRLTLAELAFDDAESAIEEARLSVVVAQSEAGRSIQVIDAPNSTFEPESSLPTKAIRFMAASFLGALMAVTILLLSTHLDRSVRSAADIEAAGAGATVAAVPVIKSLKPPRSLRPRLRKPALARARRQASGIQRLSNPLEPAS